ncbi:MAG: FAD-dependent oxidoreductase [Opitutaceae bacterium]|jgi:hypothetical protein|nr:FAD-dependent oxidoreductase [Opitutaceae bacterium]
MSHNSTTITRHDLVVFGATPGGITCAVRAAREGLRVALVHHHHHIGGMMSNGLGVFDTLYDGSRSPLYDEIRYRIENHYPPGSHGYEPHVAESVFESLVAGEAGITLIRGHIPVTVEHTPDNPRLLRSVTLAPLAADGTTSSEPRRTITASAFVDASYEGDLAALAGATMTAGREGKSVYGEPHAGRIYTFTTSRPPPPPSDKETSRLRYFPVTSGPLLPGSTGEGDRAIQACNFRVCLTCDPANRLPVKKPARYERDIFLELRNRWRFTNRLPNHKTSWNAPLLVGGNHGYPDADWPARHAIAERHRDLALGLLWFLQNDPEVPDEIRTEARRRGLPRDEFADNGHFPWEMYVREARRLVGRYVFTEHDALEGRSHDDAIAFTEWPLDSHACTTATVPGSDHEGKLLLADKTRPAQIPFRCLLPRELDNLLVTTCLSASHVGWGTIRLEPVWMHIGESAAFAISLSRKLNLAPARLPASTLRTTLGESHISLSISQS